MSKQTVRKEKQQERYSTFQVLSRLAKYTFRPALFVPLIIAVVISGTVDITMPTVMGKAIDAIVGPGNVNFAYVLKAAVTMLIFYIVGAGMNYVFNMLSNKAANRAVRDIRRDAYDKLSILPLKYYDTKAHGDIQSRFINDADMVGDGLVQGVAQLLSGIINIVGSLIFMLILSPVVTLAVLVVTSITFLTASAITKMSNKYFRAQQALVGRLNGLSEELIQGAKTVKLFNYEKRSQQRFDEINSELNITGRRAQFAGALTNPTTRFVNHLAYISVGVVGGAIAGISAGGISSFIVYSNLFAKPFNDLTSIATQIMTAIASARRIFEVMDETGTEEDAQNSVEIENSEGRVDFEAVNFSYELSHPLIRDFSLSVEPGSTVAIVGPTGAGKTTIVNLLMRFYEIDSGAIKLDNIDIRNIKRESLRRSFGMVLQDSWLFEGTVRENIAYGKEDASDEEIEAASKFAHAHSFISKLENGYDTYIGEGTTLSHGQMQLITIARTVLANPPVIILDEATSAIDTVTERRIQRAFEKMMQNRTSFVIAHRLSTIQRADIILVMDAGRVVEQGKHEELLEKKGLYYKLYNSQYASEDEQE